LLFLILSNTAALLAFLFVSVSIQSFRNHIAIEYTTCASLYCSHVKQIKEILSLDNKQKSLCQMETT